MDGSEVPRWYPASPDQPPGGGGDHPRRRNRRGGLASYIAVALISALIGGGVVAAAVPNYVYQRVETRLRGSQSAPTIPGPASPAPSSVGGGQDVPYAATQVTGVAEKVGPSVVAIVNKAVVEDFFGRRGLVERGIGSGVIFDPAGYIVTNYHVVEGAAELVVSLADGRKLKGSVVGGDAFFDLAVVRIEGTNFPAVAFGDSDKLRVGELAVAIGNPLSLSFERTVTAGIISGMNRVVRSEGERGEEDRAMKVIQTDAAINPGNSGGALANAAGQVIGINTLKIKVPGFEAMGFAIPSNTVKPVVNDLLRFREVRLPRLGIESMSPDEAWYRYNVRLPSKGVFVIRVRPGSPAEKAGLKGGDLITRVGDAGIVSTGDIKLALLGKRPGDVVPVTFNREGKETTVNATLASR